MFNGKRALKILMVFTANMNFGDTILAENDYYLIRKAVWPRKCDILRYSIFSRDLGQIQYVDAVIFAGGILKVTNENFWLYIPELIREADKWNIPVFLSAIGVEKYYPDDPNSVELKAALNLPCVKGISVRDDIETLKRDYITSPDVRVTSVFDPAVWCKQTYRNVLQNVTKQERIGLGIVRWNLFEDYGNPQITKQYQLDFWKDVASELETRGIQWALFTNGDTHDEQFAAEVLEYIGHGEKLPIPLNAEELVKNIASFKGVIAGRMHSNIVAYALGIPSIGLRWNRKLEFWGEKTGYPERILPLKDMTANIAVERLLKASDWKRGPTGRQKASVYKAIRRFVRSLHGLRPMNFKQRGFEKKLMAVCLGGMELRYKNTNSIEAFHYSLDRGYQNFHLDVRLTSDDVPVCVNRWHKDTYKIMNLSLKEDETPCPLSAESFSQCKYYYRIPTLTFDRFMSEATPLLREKKIRLLVSIGKPKQPDLEKMLAILAEMPKKQGIPSEQVMLRLEQKKAIEYALQINFQLPLVFHMEKKDETPEQLYKRCRDTLQFCQKYGIGFISMNPDIFSREIGALCKKYGIKPWVFTCTRTDRIIEALNSGADMVGSHYYDVNYLKRLTTDK